MQCELVVTAKYVYLGNLKEGLMKDRLEIQDCFVLGFDNEKMKTIAQFNPSFLAFDCWVLSDLIETISIRLADVEQIVVFNQKQIETIKNIIMRKYGTN